MDRQAWIAITLCVIGLVAWQVYVVKHPAPVPAKVARLAESIGRAGETLSSRGRRKLLRRPRQRLARRSLALPAPATPPNEATPTPRAVRREDDDAAQCRSRVAPDQSRRRHRRSGPAETSRREWSAGEAKRAPAFADRRDHRETGGAGARGILGRAGAGERAVRARPAEQRDVAQEIQPADAA